MLHTVNIEHVFRVFTRRLTNGGTFKNRLFFKKNRLLFPTVFWKFLWKDKTLMEGDKVG